jgi:exopolysaccharide production protein ExoQ
VAFRIFERLFVIAFLLLSMQVAIGLTTPDEAETDPTVTSGQVHVPHAVLELGVDLCGVLLIALRWPRVLRAVRAVWPLVGLTALAALSTAWSAQPGVTFRRSALLVVTTFLAIYLGERYSIEEQARLLAHTFCLMISAILILYIAAPRYVIDYVSHPGAWKGLSAHKNSFGQYMAIAVLVLLLVRFQKFRWLRYPFLIAAAILLFLTQSAASLFCCVLIIAVMPLWRTAQMRGKQRLALCAMAVSFLFAGMCFMATNTDWLFHLLGRNATLTGRTQLWASILPAIMKHPILGYGYDTFWVSPIEEVFDIRAAAGWLVHVADNGFLDLGLSLGIPGVCLFFLIFALSFRNGIDYLKSESQSLGLWPISYFCFFLLHNMSESTLLARGGFAFLVFVMLTTVLALHRSKAVLAHVAADTSYGECELVPNTL